MSFFSLIKRQIIIEIYDLSGIRGLLRNRIETVFSSASFPIYKLNIFFHPHEIEF